MGSNAKIFSSQKDKKPHRNKSRSEFNCPPKLHDLLIKVNWLQPHLTLWIFNDALMLGKEESPSNDGYTSLKEALEKCLNGLPVELQNFVRYGMPSFPNNEWEILEVTTGDVLIDLANQIFRYEDYRLSRLKISRLVKLKERYENDYSVMSINQDFGGAGILRIDKSGIIRVVVDSFGEAINGVIIDRIRSCEIENCCRLYWAVNKNSKACSPSHAAALRNRKSRQLNKEKRMNDKESVNEKRRKTYQNKIEMKKGKSRNGNL